MAYAFVACVMKNCFVRLSFLKIPIILVLDRLRCGA